MASSKSLICGGRVRLIGVLVLLWGETVVAGAYRYDSSYLFVPLVHLIFKVM